MVLWWFQPRNHRRRYHIPNRMNHRFHNYYHHNSSQSLHSLKRGQNNQILVLPWSSLEKSLESCFRFSNNLIIRPSKYFTCIDQTSIFIISKSSISKEIGHITKVNITETDIIYATCISILVSISARPISVSLAAKMNISNPLRISE